jgi:cell division protein FtsB
MEPVIIVFIVFAFVSFNVWLKHKANVLKVGGGHEALQAENAKLLEKTESLEARVRVLESIVTDKKFQLVEEINSLAS